MKNINNHFMRAICISALISFNVITSCNKSSSEVPYSAINEYINLNLPSYINLNVINGWVYYGAGSRGIIIYRKSQTEFIVFDRNCPYDPTASCALVKVIPNNILAVDSCCGSQFSLFDGSVTQGPSANPLLQYRNDLLTNNVLHIYN